MNKINIKILILFIIGLFNITNQLMAMTAEQFKYTEKFKDQAAELYDVTKNKGPLINHIRSCARPYTISAFMSIPISLINMGAIAVTRSDNAMRPYLYLLAGTAAICCGITGWISYRYMQEWKILKKRNPSPQDIQKQSEIGYKYIRSAISSSKVVLNQKYPRAVPEKVTFADGDENIFKKFNWQDRINKNELQYKGGLQSLLEGNNKSLLFRSEDL